MGRTIKELVNLILDNILHNGKLVWSVIPLKKGGWTSNPLL